MSRFSLNNSPISIEYGNDPEQGVLLHVTDSRRDDDKRLLKFYTGPSGEGKKINDRSMIAYLLRHGVKEDQIDELFAGLKALAVHGKLHEEFKCQVCIRDTFAKCDKCQSVFYCSLECREEDWTNHKATCDSLHLPPQVELTNAPDNITRLPSEEKCSVCANETKKSCAKCHSAYFCSKECQMKAWPVHKLICDPLPYPKREVEEEPSVYGFYLVADMNEKPIVVKVPIRKAKIEIESEILEVNEPDVTPFLGNVPIGKNFVSTNPVTGKRLAMSLDIKFRDNYYMDGSKKNLIVDKLAGDLNPVDWNGPIIILKFKEEKVGDQTRQVYVDVELADLNDAARFFRCYGTEE
jgi:hypothetical protein